MNLFLQCQVQSHVTTRNRLGYVAEKLVPSFVSNRSMASEPSQKAVPVNVFLEGAHIRCRTEYQKWHHCVVVGRVETTIGSWRFGFVGSAAPSPSWQIKEGLSAIGWRSGDPITVFSDGEAALVNYVRHAVEQPVTHILDWWHISIRIKHVQNATIGQTSANWGRNEADTLPGLAKRIRWLTWHEKLSQSLAAIQKLKHASDRLEDASRSETGNSIRKLRARCDALATCVRNNAGRRFQAMQNAITQASPLHHLALKAASTISRTREWESVRECAGPQKERTECH